MSDKIHSFRQSDPQKLQTLAAYNWISDDIKAKLDIQYDLKAEVIRGFADINPYTDTSIAAIFDMIPQKITWTAEQLLEVHLSAMAQLVGYNNKLSRKLWISHLMINPLKDMKTI